MGRVKQSFVSRGDRKAYVDEMLRGGASMAEMGRSLGITRQRVYQIHRCPVRQVGRPPTRQPVKTLLAEIGRKVRRIRLERGVLLVDLANKCKISVPDLSRFEHGFQRMKSEKLLVVLKELGIKRKDLINERQERLMGFRPKRPRRMA